MMEFKGILTVRGGFDSVQLMIASRQHKIRYDVPRNFLVSSFCPVSNSYLVISQHYALSPSLRMNYTRSFLSFMVGCVGVDVSECQNSDNRRGKYIETMTRWVKLISKNPFKWSPWGISHPALNGLDLSLLNNFSNGI